MPLPRFFAYGEEYASLMARATEAPPLYHYGVLLSIVGARLGRRVWFPYSRPLFPNLYTCLVGPSGLARKTTSIRLGLPLLESIPILTGLSSMEGLLQYLTSSPQLLIVLEELASLWMKAKKQEYSAALIPKLAELYDCPQQVDLPSRKNPITVYEPTVSVLAATTEDWLERSMDMADVMGGASNRFVFLLGMPEYQLDSPVPPDLTAFRQRITKALGRWKSPTRLCWDAEAADLWSKFYKKSYEEARATDDITRVLTIRQPEHVIKVATIMHALEGSGAAISEFHLLSAISFVDYAVSSMRQLRSAFGPVEEKVLKVLASGPLSRRELHIKIGGRINGRDLSGAVRILTEFRRIEYKEGKYGVTRG